MCTLLARAAGDLGFDQSFLAGPHQEGEEPYQRMYELENSDSATVAVKPANKTAVGMAVAEWVEPRAGTKGNTQTVTHATDTVPR